MDSADNISSKVSGLLANTYNDSEFRTALYALDGFMGENTPEARRDLRPSVQATIIKQGGQVLKEFAKVASRLEQIGTNIDSLNETFRQMEAMAESLQISTKPIVSESRELEAQENNLYVKQSLLNMFRTSFELDPHTEDILTLSSIPVDKTFFESLEEAKRVVRDCETLFTSSSTGSVTDNADNGGAVPENGPSADDDRSAVQVMKNIGDILDKAHEKLVYFVQKHLRDADGPSATMFTNVSLIRQALTTLQDRPLLFHSAISDLEDARRKVVSAEFNSALADGDGMVKPIDFYAYDPMQYLGDIMAALYAAIVGEKELLGALFGNMDMLSFEHERQSLMQIVAAQFDQLEYLDRVTAVLIKPLRLRVEKIISTEHKLLTVYKESTLLLFYAETFRKLFGLYDRDDTTTSSPITSPTTKTPQLLQTLQQLSDNCMRQFDKCLEASVMATKQTYGLSSGATTASDRLISNQDLQPPEFLSDALVDIKELLTTHESSIVTSSSSSDASVATGTSTTNSSLVDTVVEPYVQCCYQLADKSREAGTLDATGTAIFLANCLTSVKNVIAFFTFAQSKLEEMDSTITRLIDELVELQVQQFMTSSSLCELVSTPTVQDTTSININDKLDQDLIDKVALQLEDFLPAATMESGRLLSELSSSRMASNVTLRASVRFAEIYDQVRDLVNDQFPGKFTRTIDDVKILLAVD